MSFKKFCPKCGKETDSLINGVCRECFLKTTELFNIKEISIKRCKTCGKFQIKGSWFEPSEKIIEDEVKSKVKIISEINQPKIIVTAKEIEKLEESKIGRFFEINVKVVGLIDEQLLEQEKSFELELEKEGCDSCMRLNSDYREAIIQIRSENKENVEQIFNEVKTFLSNEKAKDSLSAVVKIIDFKNGLDVWIGSRNAATKVVKKISVLHSLKPTKASKLIGVLPNGKKKFRVTYCIRN